ncbi:RES domain-containing protein [Vreelandella titanicae]|uniref:RES family NAD+ phosphorylase n=1 Tax=Vreelandella titanicae TaxID=664683 RepID=UPI00315AE03F
MNLYRIAPERFISNFSGHGGSYRDGARWNEAGHPVLYFGTSASVAMLEMGNYIPNPRLVPKDYMLGIYKAQTEAIETVELSDLPDGWDLSPPPTFTRSIGTEFLSLARNLILLVPSSAAAGIDQIAVVNPLHPDIQKLSLIRTQSRIYNPRLFQGV